MNIIPKKVIEYNKSYSKIRIGIKNTIYKLKKCRILNKYLEISDENTTEYEI